MKDDDISIQKITMLYQKVSTFPLRMATLRSFSLLYASGAELARDVEIMQDEEASVEAMGVYLHT